MVTRIPLSFHETFSLNRPAIGQVISVAAASDGGVSRQELRERTSLGTRYAVTMPRYGVGCGLLADTRLTAFGHAVATADAALSSATTQWLMHYHLSAPQGPGPAFWHHVVTRVLRLGETLETADLASELERYVLEQGGRDPNVRTIRSTATVFLGSYAKAEGFDQLRLIREVERGKYLVTAPHPVPLWAFAFALIDYWEHRWGDRMTVNLADLSEPGGLASIFFLGKEAIDDLLGGLRREGIVDVYRVAPPYQVVRQWGPDAPQSCLDRVYAAH